MCLQASERRDKSLQGNWPSGINSCIIDLSDPRALVPGFNLQSFTDVNGVFSTVSALALGDLQPV